jgi:hypothetical protein
MAYAEVSDIELRWHELDSDEQSRAAVLIDDASAMLDALVNVDTSDDEQLELLKMVCCNVVIRALSATTSDAFGVSNASMTAGAYSQSWTYANPSGDMYLTKLEKRLLGVTNSYIGSIRPMMRGEHDD